VTYPIPAHSLKHDRALRFGAELRRALKARGVSRRTVGQVTGMGRNAVHNWLDGRNLPRIESCRKLAEALDWPRLDGLGEELRRKVCLVDGEPFLDDSGSDNRVYCSASCQRVAEKRRIGTTIDKRAAVAEHALARHRAAVAAFCAGCEPDGRCVTPECALRPVSPLPLFESRIEVELATPKPHNGYRAPGSDSRRMRRTWAGYTAAERAARIAKAAEASKVARGLVPA
jgi:transcriptional regulator with XRE-family HTH domain